MSRCWPKMETDSDKLYRPAKHNVHVRLPMRFKGLFLHIISEVGTNLKNVVIQHFTVVLQVEALLVLERGSSCAGGACLDVGVQLWASTSLLK